MIRYLIAGLLLFLGFAVVFAPAGLLDRGLERNSQADLTDTRGTLWQGQANLLINRQALGMVHWDFAATSLLQLAPRYDWRLEGGGKHLNGSAAITLNTAQASAQGSIDSSAINPMLQRYDIFVNGQFQLQPTRITWLTDANQAADLDGQLDWSGGLVRYTLSGILRETTLPPLSAFLRMSDQNLPEAVVYVTGEQTPLMMAALGDNGFVKVSITKLFTKLLGNPWPGSDPDHAVVIEVEEQIF